LEKKKKKKGREEILLRPHKEKRKARKRKKKDEPIRGPKGGKTTRLLSRGKKKLVGLLLSS